MTKSQRLMMVLLMLVGLGLSACGPSSEPPSCLDMPAPINHVFTAAEIHSSPPWTDLGAGESESTITFRWDYPDGCQPDRFRILVNDIPMLEDPPLYQEDVTPVTGPTVIDAHGTALVDYGWTSSETFPAGSYWYWVIPYSGSFYHGERSEPNKYMIFKDCEISTTTMLPVELVYPANADVIDSLSPTLIFRDRNPETEGCFRQGFYILLYSQVTDDLGVSEASAPDLGPWHIEGTPGVDAITIAYKNRSAGVTLADCRRTYWQILNVSRDTVNNVYTALPSGTHYFDIDPSVCAASFLHPSVFTPIMGIPTASPSPGILPPEALTRERSNCRSGPTTDYPILDILEAGLRFPVQGRNRAGDSWLVEDSNISKSCWVFGGMVDVSGDLSGVPVVEVQPPVLPSPTVSIAVPPVNCAQYNSNLCPSQPSCIWEGGVCKNR